MKEKESDIVRAICDYFTLKGHFFWRQNSTGMVRGGRYVPVMNSRRGIPDIQLIRAGLYHGFEVKTAIGRQSPEQKEFEEQLKKVGGFYHLVRSVDDVIGLGF